jgi:serine/threonine protein kinase/tetratricopeptide (TPR) repeat protein
MLGEGLETGEEVSRATFQSVIAEVDVPDKQWRLGDYEILDEIGRGGMGVIYLARQRHPQRIVAVKRVLNYHADSRDTLMRFRREADAAASLDHRNILPIYEVSESEDGLPFFSMKYATGGSLQKVAPALRTEPRKCVQLLAKVARAVEYAHGHGILHRDLKPGNILLDDQSEPLVSDFGLAKWLDANKDITKSLTAFGTPGYTAPEQAEGKASDLTPAADVYSLGAILFDLLAGRPPFLGSNALAVIRQAAESPAPKLRSVTHSHDRDLETICARCLERHPKARYQSAGDLATDLERWLEGRPIIARPVSIPTRLGRWSRRNPKLIATGAACLLFGAAMMWLFRGQLARMVPDTLEQSIAVLPFSNLSKEDEDAYFADGVQDDILTELAKIADLKVISRTSVMQYRDKRDLRQIGQALGVSHVLEGTVRRSGGKVHINAQLVDARTDTHVWAERYDRDVNELFAIQSEITQKVADQIGAKVSAAEKAAIEEPPTRDLVAYDLYIRATSLMKESMYYGLSNEENLFEAVEFLNQAIARDPAFLLAYCKLAEAHDGIYWHGIDRTPGRLDLAQAAIDSAFRLKPDSGDAHLVLGVHLYYGYLDYDRARDELDIAVRTMPNNGRIFEMRGYVNRRQGRWNDARRDFERAIELDPRNRDLLFGAAFTYICLREYKRAREIFDRGIAVDSTNNYMRLLPGWIDFHERADTGLWHATLEKIVTENPASARDLTRGRFFVGLYRRDFAAAERALAALNEGTLNGRGIGAIELSRAYAHGLVARMKGDAAGAEVAFSAARSQQEKAVRANPDDGSQLCFLGLIDAGLGRKEEALREGRRAVELLPATKDALNGAEVLYFYAVICALTGERDLAIEQLKTLAKIPAGISHGEIRLDPFWDPLRGDPRFEQIVASLVPK